MRSILSSDLQAKLLAITGGDMFDVVFDATGNARAMENGFRYIAHGGTYVLVSVVNADITFSDPEFHKRETTLMGSRNATAADFDLVLETIRSGKIRPLTCVLIALRWGICQRRLPNG